MLLCCWALQGHMPVSTIGLHKHSHEMSPEQDGMLWHLWPHLQL